MREGCGTQPPEAGRQWDRMNLPPLGALREFGGWWRWLVAGLVAGGGLALARWPLPGALPLASALVLVWAFRSPHRTPAAADALLAPADGVVDDIEEIAESPLLPGRLVRIGIFLSLLDVHATRAPVDGTVERLFAVPGGHRSALARESGTGNQRNEIWIRDPRGYLLCMRQIAGLVARRAVFAPRPGDRLLAGAVVGMIRFGSRVELYVPASCYRIMVGCGARVRAGETVLGRCARG